MDLLTLQAQLVRYPPEIVDKITEDLDLSSICALRLTCKFLADQCCGPQFLSYFHNQRTDLSRESLQRLNQISQHTRLGRAVRRVKVSAVFYDISELDNMLLTKNRRQKHPMLASSNVIASMSQDQLDEASANREHVLANLREQQQMKSDQSDIRLLADALRGFGTLATLTVDAAVMQGLKEYVAPSTVYSWYPVWVRAARVYHTTMLAIACSSIAINDLQIYTSVQRCSIPTWDINKHMPALETAGLAEAAKHIKNLSLSISTKVNTDDWGSMDPCARFSEENNSSYQTRIDMHQGELFGDDPGATADGNYPGVAKLLKYMPKLESLDLHLYKTLRGPIKRYAQVFSCIAEDVELPSLRHCKLRGLQCREESLLRFLDAHNSLVTLELHEIHMISGSWPRILAYLCTLPALQQVTLSNIWAGKLLNLAPRENGSGSSACRRWTKNPDDCLDCIGGHLLHTRTFSREEIQRERFAFANGPSGPPAGSLQNSIWMNKLREEYGPP